MIIEYNSPFRPKTMVQDGKDYKLYETVIGKKETISANSTEAVRIQVPYTKCFFTNVSVVVSVDFTKLDFHFEVSDGQGGYTSIYQHGDDVYLPKGLFSKSSVYEAELDSNIYITAYITNPSNESCEFAMNITLHNAVEVV